jgi:hypothetical protein
MLFGLAGAAVGFLGGALLASIASAVLHMSNFEGGRGAFAVAVGTITSVVGMIIAVVMTLRWRGVTTLTGILGGSVGALAGLAAITAAGIGLYYISVPHYIHPKGPPVYLKFQIAPPPGLTADVASWDTELHAGTNAAIGYWELDGPKEVDGRRILSGHVELHYRTRDRRLVLYLPHHEKRTFILHLPSDPTGAKFRQWSGWQKADYAEAATDGAATLGSNFQIRYMVESNDQS